MEIGGIFEPENKSKYKTDYIALLQTNIDDMNPEYYDIIFEKLYDNNALEVYLTPIIMKKGRPANILNVICNIKDTEIIKEIIFKESSSIGIREQYINRSILSRENKIIKTKYGNINVKFAYYDNKIINIKPEYDECKKLSLKFNIPIQKIIEDIKYECFYNKE